MDDNSKINKTQLSMILFNTMMGVEVLSLPNRLADEIGTSGWISIILGGLLSAAIMAMITSVALKYPGKSMVEFSRELLPPAIANTISFIYMVEFLIIGSLVIRLFNEVVGIFLLVNTPYVIINITIAMLAVYMVRSGIEPMGRLFIVATMLLIPIVLFAGLTLLTDIKLKNFLPLFQFDTKTLAKSVTSTISSYSGFQIAFLLVLFVKEDKDKTIKYNVMSVIFLIVFYLLTFFATLGKYGVDKMKSQIWPPMSLMRSIQIPSAFVENIDALVLSIWIITVFTTLSSVLFGASFIASRLCNTRQIKPFAIPAVLIMMYLSVIPSNLSQTYLFAKTVMPKFSAVTIFTVPVIYFIISKVKDKKKESLNG
ncbi:spore germination protein A2 [Gottschalkia acidurici 9a]|uniref:Spore germination protein A2 n=2 Tax=Clostridium acidurici TaxID=1556 RepID=K0AVD1_GOTA9|nr:spore germination protein A2 [Gottschalkia acidurici 9a]